MRSILIVSSNTVARTKIFERLERENYLVIDTDGVEEALETLAGIVPGAIVIDLPTAAATRLIRVLVASSTLRMIPRLVVIDPVRATAPAADAAAAFVAPLEPDHLVRALAALYATEIPKPRAGEPLPAAHRDDCIEEALELIGETPLRIATSPPGDPPEDRPSDRAAAVVHAYVTEMLEDTHGSSPSWGGG